MSDLREGPERPVPQAWRLKWAQRENQRRLAEHIAADQRWQTELDDLDRMMATAGNFEGLTSHRDSSVLLKKGERIYAALPRVTLIEASVAAAGQLGTDSGFSFHGMRSIGANRGSTPANPTSVPEGMRVVDHGSVTVTDRRVAFQGSKKGREWALAKLQGIEHSSTQPYTLIQVTNRQKISGILYPLAYATAWRFNLALALAVFNNDRQRLVAGLEGERQELVAARPALPPLALPEQAPRGLAAAHALKTVYFGRTDQRPARRVVRGAAMSAVTLLALLGLVGAVIPKATSTTQGGSAFPTARTSTSATTTQIALPTSQNVAPARQAAPAAIGTTSSGPTSRNGLVAVPKPKPKPTPTRPVVRSRPTPAPRPKPTPTHVVLNLCGAPTNPWGYNFCRGGYIDSPAAGFCSYFDCIANFPNGHGYVVQCVDGMFSKSGGRQGACSYHGGERRPLLT